MQDWENGPSQFLSSAFASAIVGTEVQPLPTERLRLRGATDAEEAAIARFLAAIGQLGRGDSLGNEWELRAEQLGGRSLLVGLLSQSQGDWLAWIGHSTPGALVNLEVTIDILGQLHSRPAVAIIPHRDSYCFLINRLTFHGTGVERHSDVWYVVRGKELFMVLEYPTRAYISGWCSFQREIRAIMLRRPEALVHGANLEILFRADYSDNHFSAPEHEATHLFREEHLFNAVWDDDAELFVPTSTSQLRAVDVEALFNDGDEEFFHRHRAVIEELLGSEVKERRLWAEGIHARYAG